MNFIINVIAEWGFLWGKKVENKHKDNEIVKYR